MCVDDDIDCLVGPLMPDIEAAEDALAALPTLPPVGETDAFDRSTPPTSQIVMAARFFMDLTPELDPRLHWLVKVYHRQWTRGRGWLPIEPLNSARMRLPRERPLLGQWAATQFLIGEHPWHTVQDGAFFMMALFLRESEVAEERVRSALRQQTHERRGMMDVHRS